MTVTDTFIYICPACGYKARLPSKFAGRTIRCPGCQAPQTAIAPVHVQRKSATFTKVGATPMPFSLPTEQADTLAAIPSESGIAQTSSAPAEPPPKTFPSPLPGAIQISTDRVSRTTPSGGSPTIGTSSNTARLAKPASSLVDFTCTACHARLRLPTHYAGKSILCPKCSAPQQVTQTSTEPMDTTRSLSQKTPESPLIVNSPQNQQAPPGSGTGMRIRVTPLPQTYPTPLPTAAATPTPAIAPFTITQAAPAKTVTKPEPIPIAAPLAHAAANATEVPLVDLIDSEVATSPSHTFAKPHPSKGYSSRQRPVTGPIVHPAAQPVAMPGKPVVLIAVLLVTMIALAATWAYHLVTNGDILAQLKQAQATAEAAGARETEIAAKLADLTAKLSELERKLSEAAPTPIPVPTDITPATVTPADITPATETPADITPTTVTPADVTPADLTIATPSPVTEAPTVEAPTTPAPAPTASEPAASEATPTETATPQPTTPAAEIPPAP